MLVFYGSESQCKHYIKYIFSTWPVQNFFTVVEIHHQQKILIQIAVGGGFYQDHGVIEKGYKPSLRTSLYTDQLTPAIVIQSFFKKIHNETI